MATKSGRTWKLERASVDVENKSRPRSNKFSESDSHAAPEAGSRKKAWVGGYTKTDGTEVKGHYRTLKND
jgi:hypothetical protein